MIYLVSGSTIQDSGVEDLGFWPWGNHLGNGLRHCFLGRNQPDLMQQKEGMLWYAFGFVCILIRTSDSVCLFHLDDVWCC